MQPINDRLSFCFHLTQCGTQENGLDLSKYDLSEHQKGHIYAIIDRFFCANETNRHLCAFKNKTFFALIAVVVGKRLEDSDSLYTEDDQFKNPFSKKRPTRKKSLVSRYFFILGDQQVGKKEACGSYLKGSIEMETSVSCCYEIMKKNFQNTRASLLKGTIKEISLFDKSGELKTEAGVDDYKWIVSSIKEEKEMNEGEEKKTNKRRLSFIANKKSKTEEDSSEKKNLQFNPNAFLKEKTFFDLYDLPKEITLPPPL